MAVRNLYTGQPIQTIREFDEHVASLVLEIEQPSPDHATTPLSTLEQMAFEMAAKARERDEGMGHSAVAEVVVSEPEPLSDDDILQDLPESVARARAAQEKALKAGKDFGVGTQHDLSVGEQVNAVEERLPGIIEDNIVETRGHRFFGGRSHTGVWLAKGSKVIFVNDGDERTHANRVNQARSTLESGGGYSRAKYGPGRHQARK